MFNKKLYVLLAVVIAVLVGGCRMTPNDPDPYAQPTATPIVVLAQPTQTQMPTVTPMPPSGTVVSGQQAAEAEILVNTTMATDVAALTRAAEVNAADAPNATNTPVATADYTATPAPADSECPQARDLGPWAPDALGVGETFEVTAREGDAASVVLGLWWPQSKDIREVTTWIEPGLSITVLNGAGRGFDFGQPCQVEAIAIQMAKHMNERNVDTSYAGFIDVDELVKLGLAAVRFDRRTYQVGQQQLFDFYAKQEIAVPPPATGFMGRQAAPAQPTAAAAQPTNAPAPTKAAAAPAAPAAECKAVPSGTADSRTTAPDVVWSVEAWQLRGVARTGGPLVGAPGQWAPMKGAYYEWPGCSIQDVLRIDASKGAVEFQ